MFGKKKKSLFDKIKEKLKKKKNYTKAIIISLISVIVIAFLIGLYYAVDKEHYIEFYSVILEIIAISSLLLFLFWKFVVIKYYKFWIEQLKTNRYLHKILIAMGSYILIFSMLHRLHFSQDINNILEIGLLIGTTICIIIAFLLWLLFGKDRKKYEIVEFENPNGLNPLEMAFFYYQDLKTSDIVPLLVDLMNRGYLKFDNKYFYKKNRYDGDNEEEKKFLELFPSNILMKKFDETTGLVKNIEDYVKNLEVKMKELYLVSLPKINDAFENLTIFSFLLMTFSVGLNFLNIDSILIGLLCSCLIFLPILLFVEIEKRMVYIVRKRSLKTYSISMAYVFFFWFIFQPTIMFVGFSCVFSHSADWIKIFLAIFVLNLLIRVFHIHLDKWNEKGSDIVNKVLGFKKYLKKVEIDKIKYIEKNDIQKYCKLVPYMYMFNIKSNIFKKYDETENEEMPIAPTKGGLYSNLRSILSGIERVKKP